MQLGYFTERPYRHLDEDIILRNRAFFGVSNDQFDREAAADDYNYYLDEYCFAEQLGFDVLALNEHHGNPICMGNVMNVEAAILARITSRARIALIGNPLPVIKHPLRMAEELATIDLISRGRLITGWVRGAGSEQFFNNANPAYNREMFNEAHDFILRAWTEPGPWRYEGTHFHYRHVNPWALPYQKPYPPVWIPGVLSPETIRWAAEHRYPYIGLGTHLLATCDMWDLYADVAAENGWQAGPENFGYLMPVFVADTEERAQDVGRGFVYGGGQNAFSAPQYMIPPGYNSKEAIRRLAHSKGASGSWVGLSRDKLVAQATGGKAEATDLDVVRGKLQAAFKRAQRQYQIVVGTPDSVAEKLKQILSVIRPGAFVVLHIQGAAGNEDRMRSVELLGKVVMPELREHAEKIGLVDGFERRPGSVELPSGVSREPVLDRLPLSEMGLV
ncbi:MAG: LLM class flavin-dependent oxidoreductase [Myxococcales bacterium]|nr:LLM class flavin-dependent oxidoreductase [Myxococcales bacterium]